MKAVLTSKFFRTLMFSVAANHRYFLIAATFVASFCLTQPTFSSNGDSRNLEFFKVLIGTNPPRDALKVSSDAGVAAYMQSTFGDFDAFDRIKDVFEKTGYLISLSQSFNSNYDSTHDSRSKQADCIWSRGEIELMSEALLNRIPKHLYHLRSLRGIYCGNDDKTARAYARTRRLLSFSEQSSGVIVMQTELYGAAPVVAGPRDRLINFGPVTYLHTFVHEFGHHVDFSLATNNSYFSYDSGFYKISWRSVGLRDGGVVLPDKYGSFLRMEGRQHYTEDFADTFAGYILTPTKLGSRSQEKFDFMRDQIFAGVEFPAEGPEIGW